jgi:transaldolase
MGTFHGYFVASWLTLFTMPTAPRNEVLAQPGEAGIDVDALAAQLQTEGAESFVKSWNDLMAVMLAAMMTPSNAVN